MGISTIILYLIALTALGISLLKDRKKTKMGIIKGFKAFKKIVFMLIPFFLIVGAFLTIITPEIIKSILGEDSGILGVMIGLLAGGIAFMPPFVTYPLGAELLSNGAGYAQVAALVTSAMAVGFVYIGIETKFFGKKAVLLRNSLALSASAIVAAVIWMVM